MPISEAYTQGEERADPAALAALARAVIEVEANAIGQLAGRIDEAFVRACQLILACKGRVVVLGMGKSGHVGGKIAATLASTGTPAFFVHPGEASHGDLGMLVAGDVVLALSNSGETEELLTILPGIKRLGVPLITITGNAASTLARSAEANLNAAVDQEACPLDLAPTASTTAALAMGDALAVALLQARGFSREDFSRTHPRGKLGRRLLLRVADVMVTDERMPVVAPGTAIGPALLEMTRKGLGITAVVSAEGAVCGVFTDGDLRRALEQGIDLRHTPIDDVMTANAVSVDPELLAAEAVLLMEQKRINALLVVDDQGKLAGVLNMHGLLSAGVV